MRKLANQRIQIARWRRPEEAMMREALRICKPDEQAWDEVWIPCAEREGQLARRRVKIRTLEEHKDAAPKIASRA